MELQIAIKQRKSIRKFLDKPVSKETLAKILTIAVRAPSAENAQPWEFVVVAGDTLERLRAANVEKIRNFKVPPEEMAHVMAKREKGSIYRQRQIDIAKRLFASMEIERDDKVKRAEWMERGFRYFDAPAAIIIVGDKSLPIEGSFLDAGAVMQNICLAALDFGLCTCIENQGITYSDAVREIAEIPDSKRLLAAIAIGYPDWNFPANQVTSQREDIENVVTWRGI